MESAPDKASSHPGGMALRLLRYRVRTLMAVVVVAALLVWGGMMVSRSYEYSRRATLYHGQERGWRQIGDRKGEWAQFGSQCAEYYAELGRKYRRAMWRPWMPVAPDPLAPGVREA